MSIKESRLLVLRAMKERLWGLSALLILLFPLVSAGSQSIAGSTEADVLWGQIVDLAEEFRRVQKEYIQREGRAPDVVLTPAKSCRVRELAMEFCERNPADPRTAWLRYALMSFGSKDPFYPFDSAVNAVQSYEVWAAGGDLNPDLKADELLRLPLHQSWDFIARHIGVSFGALQALLRTLPVTEQRKVWDRIAASPDETLQQWAQGRKRFLGLSENPLELKLPTAAGGFMDLRQFRGKVVLVDVWSMGCSSCIEFMPKLQALYEKYRDQGFEIVGVFLVSKTSDAERAKEVADSLKIMQRQGATWIDAAMPDKEAAEKFRQTYAFSGVPQWWLLDQSGRLVMDVGGNEFMGPRAGESRIEQEIRRLLRQQPDAPRG